MSDAGADLSTVETVSAEEHTVRVARTADGTAWQATAIDGDGGSASHSSGRLKTISIAAAISNNTPDSDDDADLPGPTVTAPHRWVAIGFAIEAYEWGEVGEEPVGVHDGYATVSVDGETFDIESVDLEMSDGVPSWHRTGGETFTGSFTLDTGDEDDD